MTTPVMLAVVTLVSSGLVRFFWKFAAVNEAYGPSFMLVQGLGFCIVFLGAHFTQSHQFELSSRLTTVALLGGMLGGVGVLALYLAFSLGGQGSILLPIAALSILVSVPLSFIVFHEPVTATKLLGLGFGVTSIIFLSR